MLQGMKTRVNMRLRPVRTIAFFGLASLAAVPVSVARAGTEEPVGIEASIGLAPDNSAAIDLIPASENAELGLQVGAVSELAQSDVVEALGAGEASWYGPKFAGRRTASGETFNPTQLTAAHRTLPFGSLVRVTSSRTGKSVVVRINDRGPYHGDRVIDLSEAAAKEIGIKQRGSGTVDLALLQG